MKNGTLRMWAKNNDGVLPMVGSLVFKGPELVLSCEEGSLPSPQTKSYSILNDIKIELAKKGVFRYADMFAFAECLLQRMPNFKERLSARFPLVFIDEMQDTSWMQEELLGKLFDDTVVLQRFGDTNQRILGNGAGYEKLTFPKADALPISTSKRFGPAIAAAVSGVRVGGKAVVGEAVDVHPPVLLTYSSARVGDVLDAFGRRVLERFGDEDLRLGAVKALCTRKQGNAKQEPGRTLLDYWPAYIDQSKSTGARADCIWSLLAHESAVRARGMSLHDRAADAKRAVLLVLQSSASPHVSTVRDGTQLLRHLHDDGLDVTGVRQLCRDLTLSTRLGATEESRLHARDLFYHPLRHLLPEGMTLTEFRALEVFNAPQQLANDARCRTCEVTVGTRRIEIEIGTVASMKGETHLATLVLESLGHPSRRFDLAEALPVISGLKARDQKWNENILSQFRNLYVGMSRPTNYLCVAANARRVSTECITALREKGWEVQRLE